MLAAWSRCLVLMHSTRYISDSALLVKMQDFMVKQEEKVLEKASRLEGIKWQQYLDPSAKREVT